MPGTAENCDGGIEKIVCENRISALPDDLLVTILMSVPIKDAVATMILSKRWRFIWMMLPTLDYKESDDDDESKKSIWWFLDKSLQFHKAPVLGTLCMELGPRCPSDADIGRWIAKAVDRRVFMLDFKLLWSADPTSLPKTLYSCESLRILCLSHKILLDVPFPAYLPSLKMLNLNSLVYKNEDSLIRLLSCCPILESMFVIRKKDDNVKKFTVKAPRLLDLMYINPSSDDDVEDTGGCLVIDTPALTVLNITDYSGDSCSIENTPCFEEVYIGADRSFPDIDKFLRSISGVLFLELVLTEEMIKCCSTIKFSRLTKCKIFPCDSDWMGSLVSFLQNTPKLKFLIVDYEFTHQPPNAATSWSKSSYDPECVSTSLEKFELIDYEGREEEQELAEYILTTLKLEDKDTLMEELKAIPRASITSQLLFKTLDIHTYIDNALISIWS